MNRKVALVTLACLAVFVLARSASGSTAPAGLSGKVLLVGDSLAVGLSAPLRRVLGGKLVVHAKEGTRTDQWLSLGTWVAEERPAVVLICLGTNDAMMGKPSVNQTSIAKLVGDASASGARVIWVLPPTLPATIGKTVVKDDVVRDMVVATGVETFDSRKLDIPRAGDRVHPTSRGYQLWADALLSTLQSR